MNTIVVILLSTMTVTSYRPIRSQTDDSPYITSIGEHVSEHGVAVSRDLLCPMALSKDIRIKRHTSRHCKIKQLHYGDTLYIQEIGWRIVNDCMNARHKRALDIFVWTKKEERAIGTRHNVQVWRVYNETTQGSASH